MTMICSVTMMMMTFGLGKVVRPCARNCRQNLCIVLKVYDPIHPSKWSFWYQMRAPIFLITPVKYDMQQMLILKVTSENAAKVQKLL